jgi:hypothetical protein
MNKTSTLIYSIHNLASKTYHQLTETDDIDGRKEFGDIYEMLDRVPLFDVNSKIIEEILKYADQPE